jgi:sterol desaturase/sphingolipid hydroxylase (fatty acid hydroxylase superfamily)
VVNSAFLAQHANVAFPRAIEALRVVFVTPAVHRQHHSPVPPLIDRNFGQMFSFWDRMFGTMRNRAPRHRPSTACASSPASAGRRSQASC